MADHNQPAYGGMSSAGTRITGAVPNPTVPVVTATVSADAQAAAEKLEKAVCYLETFAKYEPEKHRPGWALVNDFTQGMHPMKGVTFYRYSPLDAARVAVANLQNNINNKVTNDRIRLRDLDTTAVEEVPGEMVNRWAFFTNMFLKDERRNVAADLNKAIENVKIFTDELENCLNQ